MTITLTTGGYIISDSDVIYGYGSTVDEATADFENEMRLARVELLDDDDDQDREPGAWTRRSGFKTWPATSALMQQIADQGGAAGWRDINGIACTITEYHEHEA